MQDVKVKSSCRFFTGKINKRYEGVFLLNSHCQMVHLGTGDIFDREPEVLNYKDIEQGGALRILYEGQKIPESER
jgi:hypothetical protein